VLAAVADEDELMVPGCRGLSGIGGFLIGTVGPAVVAHADQPVVLVRAGEQAADEHEMDPADIPSAATPYRPVVGGRRRAGVRAVSPWTMPPYYVYGPASIGLAVDPAFGGRFAQQERAALTGVLQPWREKYPFVEVIEDCGAGSASPHD
jgi:hypothetical protein